MFRNFVFATVAFSVCAAATYAAVFFGALTAWHVLGVVDRDGGGTMGLAFVIAAVTALVGGGAGAIVAVVFANRRGKSAPSRPDERQHLLARFALVAGVLAGGLAGFLLAKFAFWLVGPISYDAMWKAMVHAWAPTLIMIAGAIVGWLFTRRLLRS